MDTLLDSAKQTESDMNDLIQMKTIGLSHLEKNNFSEAVRVYKKILSLYPEDIESYLLLGDLYLANEDYRSAEKLYQKALSLEPDNAVIQRRVKLSASEIDSHPSDEIPTDSESVSKFLQEIMGRSTPVTDEEVQNAAALLNEIVHSRNPAEMVARQLEQIDSLLPALIELNIRQARNDRRFDLVNMLQALLDSISKLMGETKTIEPAVISRIKPPSQANLPILRNIELLVPDSQNISKRMCTLAEFLQKRGCNVSFSSDVIKLDENKPEIIIASNPHVNPSSMEKLAKYSTLNFPIILDLDDDFEYLPINHPNYMVSGLGSLDKSRAYNAAMLFANVITVPGDSIAAHIAESGYQVEVIPVGWSVLNEQWKKQNSRKNSVNIGLVGIQGNFEDVQKYRRIIIRVLREFPQTRLVVCGDSTTYKLFENIAENRRVFLPSFQDDDMSYILGQMDILLVPLNTTPYHLVTTDQLLMQAGVKGIPWIASPMPDYIRWQVGGVTADNPEEWHSYLRQFVQDTELRITLGQAGKEKAFEREETNIGARWIDVINSALLQNSK